MHSQNPATQQRFLDALGTRWFTDGSYNIDNIPAGYRKLLRIALSRPPTQEEIQDVAMKAPGAVWYIGGEPNRKPGFEAASLVEQLHDLYTEIKAADPTARITSPSLLNWDFTCIGCSGYQSGHAWVDEFRREYATRYGTEPPIDIWAIDVYPIDWTHLPTTNSLIAINQVEGMRQYLDSTFAFKDTPIWITEFSLHWGWDAWEFVEGCATPKPSGTYETQDVVGYLKRVFDWLEANSEAMNIERWFMYTTFADIFNCNNDAYAGVTLFEDPGQGSDLTPVGRYFRGRVHN